MHRAFVLLLFAISVGCATPNPAVAPVSLDWLRGCWIADDRQATLRWLPPRGGGAGLVGDWWDAHAGADRWVLEPRPSGLTLVRPITTPGGPVETFVLIGGGPAAAEFAGATDVRLVLEGGEERLTITLEGPDAAATLFAGARDGCD